MTISHIEYDGPGELAISGIAGPVQESTAAFDRILTVCQDRVDDNVSDEQAYDFFCMSDGPHNGYGGDHSYELFSDAAETLEMALRNGESVLIHCHMGQSRSVSVASAALSVLLVISVQDALDLIHEYRDVSHYPDQLLLEHARTYAEDSTFRFHNEEVPR